MGIFEVDFVAEHVNLENFPTCVETGTGLAQSTDILQQIFKQVYTIELNEALYNEATAKFCASGNVTCILGDSAYKLGDLILCLNTATIFFLDAHWSGDDSVDWNSSHFKGYGRNTSHRNLSKQSCPTSCDQVPLLEEITTIVSFPYACAIYVDDLDKFGLDGKGLKDKGFLGEDYSHLDWNYLVDLCRFRLEGEFYKENQALLVLSRLNRHH